LQRFPVKPKRAAETTFARRNLSVLHEELVNNKPSSDGSAQVCHPRTQPGISFLLFRIIIGCIWKLEVVNYQTRVLDRVRGEKVVVSFVNVLGVMA
jgi:hypothetical protein